MALTTSGPPFEAQLWPQGDARDPLGVWGFRLPVTGDATGNPIKVFCRVPAAKRSAYVYTCYSAQIAQLTGAITASTTKLRLLTNWPNVSDIAGVQAYSTLYFGQLSGDTSITAPIAGPLFTAAGGPWVAASERFLLLFDPRQPESLGDMDILEFVLDENTDAATYSFEAYGYFWDRSVMQAPGGPRHPGAS